MSVAAMAWAFDQDVPPATKAVLLAIANFADEHGVCWPSVNTIGAKAGMSRRQVFRHLDRLEELLCISKVERDRADGSRTTSKYRLILGARKDRQTEQNEGVSEVTPGGVTNDTGGVAKVSPHEPSVEPKDSSNEESLKTVHEIFEFWKSTFGKNGKSRLTPGRRTKVTARLHEGYDAERIKRAILGCAGSSFHVEKGHTDLELICRSGEKLEWFEDKPPSKGKRERRYTHIANPS